MTMRPELLRHFYADSTMPMARRRTRRVETVLRIAGLSLFFAAWMAVLLINLWLISGGS